MFWEYAANLQDNTLAEVRFAEKSQWNHTSAWVLSCNFSHIHSTPFPKNTYGNCLCITKVNLWANICTNSAIKAMEKLLASVFLCLTLNKYSSTIQCTSLFLIFYPANEKYFHWLKVHYCRLENLPIYFNSYEYNTLKISHSRSQEFSSYSPVMFAFFLKSRLIFNIFYCFCMFVNKHFGNFTGI